MFDRVVAPTVSETMAAVAEGRHKWVKFVLSAFA